jgi:outer membrane lipoprotein SlyB
MTRFILIALSSALVAGGCVSSTSGNVYPRNQTRQAWTVEEGKVSDIKEVKIEGQRTYLGHVGGGYIGYEVGRYVGNGRGRDVAGAVGSVAGAVAGGATEEALTREQGLQITVALDKGSSVAVVQAADQQFAVGERVKILRRGDGAARVTKI